MLAIVSVLREGTSTMAWNTTDIPDLSGKVAVATGANGGLGLESAKALAGAGVHVVMAARNQEKAQAASDEIKAEYPDASLEIVELVLGSFEGTKAAAGQIAADHPSIEILINNAGLMAMPERCTADGYEMQFGVKHLGHWILTAGLLRSLLAGDDEDRLAQALAQRFFGGRPDSSEHRGEFAQHRIVRMVVDQSIDHLPIDVTVGGNQEGHRVIEGHARGIRGLDQAVDDQVGQRDHLDGHRVRQFDGVG
jgi:NAD(P)-dependent dehydrogenase (short-subunit alcohol dehydrogenase family)